LHERGYTYLTIPKLTYLEINMLIDENNKIQKEKEKQAKKASRKARRRR